MLRLIVSPAMRRHRLATFLLALALIAVAARGSSARAAAADESAPWNALDELRLALRRDSPLVVDFTQTFLPAGFSEGEVEEGTLGIALPHCLRWDYGEPFPKSFLLCDEVAYYWNPGESHGRRYPVKDEEAPGLDFFLLDSEDLRLRYSATAIATKKTEETEEIQQTKGAEEEGGLRLRLLPVRPSDDVVELIVLLDHQQRRVLGLSYRDIEGNLTEFRLSDYRQGAPPGLFVPPPEVTWEDP